MNINKKILYITYDGMTDPLGQSQVLPYLCGLAKLGYQFTLLSFEKKDKFERLKPVIENITTEAGIKWVPLVFTKKPPVLAKLYDLYQMRKTATALHRRYRFDLIHCRSYIPVSSVLNLCKQAKIPYLFDMRGFWVDERVDNGQWNLSNPFYRMAYRFYKGKEKVYFRQAAHVISLTQTGRQELINKYAVPPEKITVIPCCADLALFDYQTVSADRKAALRQELGIPAGKKVISYLGSLGGWYLTDEMLAFYSNLRKATPDYIFLFITYNRKEEIMRKVSALQIPEETIVVKPADRNEVPEVLSLSDWSIFFIKDAYSKKASSPTKQGEIMAMGIPLICNNIGDTGAIVSAAKAGIVIRQFDESHYTEAVHDMLNSVPPDPQAVRQAAFEHYDLQNGIKRYAAVYQSLIP